LARRHRRRRNLPPRPVTDVSTLRPAPRTLALWRAARALGVLGAAARVVGAAEQALGLTMRWRSGGLAGTAEEALLRQSARGLRSVRCGTLRAAARRGAVARDLTGEKALCAAPRAVRCSSRSVRAARRRLRTTRRRLRAGCCLRAARRLRAAAREGGSGAGAGAGRAGGGVVGGRVGVGDGGDLVGGRQARRGHQSGHLLGQLRRLGALGRVALEGGLEERLERGGGGADVGLARGDVV